jgi:DNA relaxase NicK
MKTTIDWMTVRTQATPQDALEGFKPMFGDLGTAMSLKALERGAMGFESAAQIVIAGMPVGRMDFGGESQRGWLRASITGTGCEWVQDWPAAQAVEQLPSAQLRRLDIALTTWEGQINHEAVVQAHTVGRFTNGGRPPDLQQITSSNPLAGRTCYVGKRTADKFFRAYEKGYEMASKCRRGTLTHVDGHPVGDIYRCELELKAGTRELTWDLIERRDQYFAGSYPFCADVLPGVEADILERRKERAPQTDLAAALENVRIQYGPTLYTALLAYGGDMTTVWDKVIGREHNQALVEAGVLLVDHE